MKIFFAYAVIHGWVIISGGVVNAYAQTAMPEGEVQYMAVDPKMIYWWLENQGTRLSLDMICRINMALQGHPCAGQWWANKLYSTSRTSGSAHYAMRHVYTSESLRSLKCYSVYRLKTSCLGVGMNLLSVD
jgi:hypothetical protein